MQPSKPTVRGILFTLLCVSYNAPEWCDGCEVWCREHGLTREGEDGEVLTDQGTRIVMRLNQLGKDLFANYLNVRP